MTTKQLLIPATETERSKVTMVDPDELEAILSARIKGGDIEAQLALGIMSSALKLAQRMMANPLEAANDDA